MTVDANGKMAVTHVKRLFRLEQGMLIAARLETGRTHQIRVHLSALGILCLVTMLYAPKELATGDLQLHAGYLAFDHPTTNERIAVFAVQMHRSSEQRW